MVGFSVIICSLFLQTMFLLDPLEIARSLNDSLEFDFWSFFREVSQCCQFMSSKEQSEVRFGATYHIWNPSSFIKGGGHSVHWAINSPLKTPPSF